MKTKVIYCENCTQGWVYKTDLEWYPQCCRSWKWQPQEPQTDEWDYSWHWPSKQSKASKRRSAQRAAEHQAASQFLNSQRTGDGDWDMFSPPGLSIQEDKYKDAIAALWEHAEPDAQRVLREAGIPPPSGHDELPNNLQEYKRVTGEHRALISKKIRLQAKTEALKKQFEEAVDQLTAVSGKIEAVEQEMEKAHARVKDQINAPKQPRITGVTNLLKEAGVTLSPPDQTGALTKFLATVGDQDLDVPSLWKAEAGVPGELLDSDWFSQEASGRHGEYGPSRNDHRTRSNPLSRRSRSPTREGTNAET